MRKQRPTRFIAGIIFLLSLGAAGMGFHHEEKEDGRIPLTGNAGVALEKLETDIRKAGSLLAAGPDRLVVWNREGGYSEYLFCENTLWLNGEPVIADIGSFVFEYRDIYGNWLTRPEKCRSSVASVGYLIRIHSGSGNRSSEKSIDLAFDCKTGMEQAGSLAWNAEM